MLAEMGAHVLSSDATAKQLMQPGEEVYSEIVRVFGESVVTDDGMLDRSALSVMAFRDGRLAELEAIVHPAVLQTESEWAAALPSHGIGVVEAAIFFERLLPPGTSRQQPGVAAMDSVAGRVHQRFDKVVLVVCSEEKKIERFVQRAGGVDSVLARADAVQRLALQIPDAVKEPYCDFVVRNDGTLSELQVQVEDLWQQLKTKM